MTDQRTLIAEARHTADTFDLVEPSRHGQAHLYRDLADALEAVVAERDEWERRANREYERARAAVAERDALRDELDTANRAWEDDLQAMTGQRDALRDAIRTHQKAMEEWGPASGYDCPNCDEWPSTEQQWVAHQALWAAALAGTQEDRDG